MSFAYLMFFGVGAYGVSLPRYAVDTNWSALVIGLIAAAALALDRPFLAPDAVDLLRHGNTGGHLGLQRARFAAFGVIGGEDGHSFKVPKALQSGFKLVHDKLFGTAITRRDSNLLSCLCCRCDRLLAVAEVVNSPLARVLKLSARARFAPKRLATAPSSIARSPLAFRLARRAPGRALVALRRPGQDVMAGIS
jgi:branched-chain amino acid transport system permease protein